MKTPATKKSNALSIIIWLGLCAALWVFVVGPWVNGPAFTETGFSHLMNNLSEVNELFVEENGRTLVYTLGEGNTMYRTTSPGAVTGIVNSAISNGAAVGAAPPSEPAGMGLMLMMGIIPVLILVSAMVYMGKKQGSGLMQFGKTKTVLIEPSKNKTRLSDVISNPGEHDEAKEIIDFLTHTQDYENAKAEFPKGIMLAGAPGTGKTLLARAIAGEAGVPFFSISGSEFVEMFVGVGASRVRDLFKQAKEASPSIIFIDEIDAVGRSRGGSGSNMGGNDERGQTLNQLLVEMDGFDDHTGVLVMAATNMPEVLDPALMRPGRFDRIISVSLPDVQAREKILDLQLKDVNRDVGQLEVRQIAKGTPGFSGAELGKLVKEAAIYVAREKRSKVTFDDMEKAKDKVLMGAESPRDMQAAELKQTAYHEAGHAIVSWIVPDHDPVYKVSIVPRGRALGVTQFLPDEERYSHSFEYLNSMIATLYGGRVAEAAEFGDSKISTGASNDIERATLIARNMVTKWGFTSLGVANFSVTDQIGSSVFSDATLNKIDEEIRAILAKNYSRAQAIINEHRDKLNIMAARLIEKETIGRDEIEQIMNSITLDLPKTPNKVLV